MYVIIIFTNLSIKRIYNKYILVRISLNIKGKTSVLPFIIYI